MENLNAEQIIKALEWAIDKEFCSNCLCTAYGESIVEFYKEILALITSQEQKIRELGEENERLQRLCKLREKDHNNALELLWKEEDETKRLESLCASKDIIIGDLNAENEGLRNRITCQVVLPDEKLEEIKNECLERVELDIKKIEADTVRKMQERLTSFFANDDFVKYNEVDADYINECIDQIAKELLNDAGE